MCLSVYSMKHVGFKDTTQTQSSMQCCSQSNLFKYDTVLPYSPPAHTYLTPQWLCIALSIKSQIP